MSVVGSGLLFAVLGRTFGWEERNGRKEKRKEMILMSEVSIKFLAAIKVASLEKEGPREGAGKTLQQLTRILEEKKVKLAGVPLCLFHDDPKSEDAQKVRYEVCFPISGRIKGEGEVKGKELPRGAFACITHSGSIEKLPDAYREILGWIEENGWQITGAGREVYHKGVGGAEGPSQECLIEVQFPVVAR
jgi:effector-binding domain-containing protein